MKALSFLTHIFHKHNPFRQKRMEKIAEDKKLKKIAARSALHLRPEPKKGMGNGVEPDAATLGASLMRQRDSVGARKASRAARAFRKKFHPASFHLPIYAGVAK